MDKRYTVAQTVQITGLKPYVLRYWEEELDLRIGRNELGHRYYTGYDIQLFMNIQELKKRGLQLKAIKELVPQIARNAPGMSQSKVRLLEDTSVQMYTDQEKDQDTEQEERQRCKELPPASEDSGKILEFQQILERLIQQELHTQNDGEARCRSIDAAIRRQQLARKEAAVAIEKKNKKKHKIHM
ncbi:MAG: MerR family transcriptional regulator [Blautia sp.]